MTMGLLPGDPHRYDNFIRFIRDRGVVTPLLSGVDRPPVAPGDLPRHLLTVDDVQIVPVETTAYSQVSLDVGISAPSWTRIEDAVRAGGIAEELDSLRKLRIVDAARILPTQLEAVRTMLRSMYLTKDAITATLRQVAVLAPGSTLVMSFILPIELADPEAVPASREERRGPSKRDAFRQLLHADGDARTRLRSGLGRRAPRVSGSSRAVRLRRQDRWPWSAQQLGGVAGGNYLASASDSRSAAGGEEGQVVVGVW